MSETSEDRSKSACTEYFKAESWLFLNKSIRNTRYTHGVNASCTCNELFCSG